jgi:putative ABC transport system permease protein
MCYPTILLLRSPIKSSLKNQLISNNKLVGRQVIIIAQFTLAIGLLVTSFVVKKQLNLMLNKDLGFHSENIIKTSFIKPEPFPVHPTEQTVKDYKERWEKQKENFQIIKNELSTNTIIESFAQFQSPIEAYLQPWGIDDGRNEFESQYTIHVSPNQLDVFDFKLVAGRFFDLSIDKERGPRVVVNEAALKYWGINDISKIRLKNGYQPKDQGNEIIGVVKDFNFRHLSVKPQPLVMLYWENTTANVFIRFKSGEIKSGLAFVKNLHDQFILNDPFKYTFLTEEIAALYNREKRLGQIYTIFTLIAFLISMSGLFVIALYDTERRKKEIGIRKVNGAKILEVMATLNRDFVKWVAIAFTIATPIAYFAMNKWLENFAYKTSLSWWIFALAGVLALGIALFTVSWQSWKAATRNPVEALRYE